MICEFNLIGNEISEGEVIEKLLIKAPANLIEKILIKYPSIIAFFQVKFNEKEIDIDQPFLESYLEEIVLIFETIKKLE